MLMPADSERADYHTSEGGRYRPGELVRHKRYGYRGVVVEVDLACNADDSWYQTNQTQPDRDQPWYHVLVDQSSSTTYAAEENLIPDASGEPIDHPLLNYFFSGFAAGMHIRNETPWPTP